MNNLMKKKVSVLDLIRGNSVPLMFVLICAVFIPLSGFSGSYLLNEIMTRLGRNAFLILSLLIPIMAGMGRSGVSPVWCWRPSSPSPSPSCWA